jgi:hypothetical protein
VAEHERQLRVGKFPVDDVEVGSANAAGGDANQYIALAGLGHGKLALLERSARCGEDHRAH